MNISTFAVRYSIPTSAQVDLTLEENPQVKLSFDFAGSVEVCQVAMSCDEAQKLIRDLEAHLKKPQNQP